MARLEFMTVGLPLNLFDPTDHNTPLNRRPPHSLDGVRGGSRDTTPTLKVFEFHVPCPHT